MDPTQQYSPAYLAEDRSYELVNVVIALAILETFFIALFFTSRIMNHTANGWDVYLMIPGYLFCFAHIVIATVMLRYGGAGRHVVALKPAVVTLWLKLDVAEEFIYNFSIAFPKLAILCLYRRVFSTKSYHYAISAIGFGIILTCLAGQIAGLTICQPFSYVWDKSTADGHCGDIAAAYRYISIPNLFTDVCIIALPLYGVWHLQTKAVQKIGLTVTFLMGCSGIVTGIIRLVYFFRIDMFADVTYHSVGTMSWTLVEPGVYLIAATLPSLRPLVRYLFKHLDLRTLYNGLLHRYSRVFSSQKFSAESTTNQKYSSAITKTTNITAGSGPRSAGFSELRDLNTQNPPVSQDEAGTYGW